jgi:hypothetical protein
MRKMRSGGSTVLFIVGGTFLVSGVAAAIGLGIATVTSGEPLLLLGVAGAALFALLGAVLLAMAWRTGVVLEADGIGWTPMIGRRRFTPWGAVQQVLVPGDTDPGSCVQLLLRDGRIEQVRALSKTKHGESNRRIATRGYLTRGQRVIEAHQRWLAGAASHHQPRP